MSDSQVLSLAVGVVLTVPMEVLERHTAASPVVVGEELAHRVDAYARGQGLGYYPPLEYCEDMDAVPTELLDAVHNIAWLSRELVREEVKRRLAQVFSSLRIDVMQSTAFTMPRVRLGQPNGLTLLARHFTADSVRVGLTVGLEHATMAPEDLQDYVRQLLWRWLRDRFSTVEITCSQVV